MLLRDKDITKPSQMTKHAIFLGGPIGSGKTTLGRGLAERLAGGFVDGDDFSDPNHPWYCSILRTSTAIVQAGAEILDSRRVVVVAYPIGCINWIYFRRKFDEFGVTALFVSLTASYASIIDDRRGRVFSREEKDRLQVMIAEGYHRRPFGDLVWHTDQANFATTLQGLEEEIRRMMAL